jgi:hypothetical protein
MSCAQFSSSLVLPCQWSTPHLAFHCMAWLLERALAAHHTIMTLALTRCGCPAPFCPVLCCAALSCPVSFAITNRLRAKGLLADIQGEWDDWQHDLLLDTIQLQLSNPGAAPAPPARQRRGRAEMEGSAVGSASAAASAGTGSQEPRLVSGRCCPVGVLRGTWRLHACRRVHMTNAAASCSCFRH